jgi:cytochrome c553
MKRIRDVPAMPGSCMTPGMTVLVFKQADVHLEYRFIQSRLFPIRLQATIGMKTMTDQIRDFRILPRPSFNRASARIALLLVASVTGAPAFAQRPSIDQDGKTAAQVSPQSVAVCVGCHGARGEGNASFPRLAGTGSAYLQAQLDAFANGTRKNAVMQPFAQKLTPGERKAVATYYSQLPAPFAVAAGTSTPLPAEVGAWLAVRGRWSDQVPACAQCHGPGGSGVGTQFPPLAGLPVAYITEQLNAWKTGTRPPGPLELMPAVARKLSDGDISAVASYYANLAPGTQSVPDATRK